MDYEAHTAPALAQPDRSPGPIEVFDAHLERFEALIAELRATVTTVTPAPSDSVLMEGGSPPANTALRGRLGRFDEDLSELAAVIRGIDL